MARRWTLVCAGLLLGGGLLFPDWIQAGAALGEPQSATPPAADDDVPSDLKPLLAAPESELRLVTERYSIDRTTLNGNYDGGRGPGRGGRGGRRNRAGCWLRDSCRSPSNRLARLKRYRHELAVCARQARHRQTLGRCQDRCRNAEDKHSGQPDATRRRCGEGRAVDAACPLRLRHRQAERVAHPAGGCTFARRRRHPHEAETERRADQVTHQRRVECSDDD